MNDSLISLPDTVFGREYVIRSIDPVEKGDSTLNGYGIIPGASIKHLFDSPAKDPAAYEVMGAVLALRLEDAKKIFVSPDPDD